MIAPAAVRRSTTTSSSSGTKLAYARAPPTVRMPLVAIKSLMAREALQGDQPSVSRGPLRLSLPRRALIPALECRKLADGDRVRLAGKETLRRPRRQLFF